MITTRSRSAGARCRGVIVAAMLALSLAGGLAGSAQAQDAEPITLGVATSDLGTFLTGPNGMTLYYFTRDVVPGVSVCGGPCAEAWPPLTAEPGQAVVAGEGVTGVIATAPRADDSLQVTYDGRPLYYWKDDQQPGDTTGQGVGGVWFVALEDGSMPPDPPAVTLGVGSSDVLGDFLVGRDGLTLYVFTRDTVPGVSTCEGDCATAWPPLTIAAGNTAAAGEGVPGVVGRAPRADGSWQVTYDGRPLYYFQGDTEAGQTNGHDMNDVWYVAALDGLIPAEE
jgi:predicted lipoprotein with Yx(FWY)xxD motif